MIEVVGAVIVDSENRVLCGVKDRGWEFVGGKIEQDETPQQALIREVKEEIGCDIVVGELVKDVTQGSIRLRTYIATIANGEPVLKEHKGIIWLRKDEVDNLDWLAADIPTVEYIAEGNLD